MRMEIEYTSSKMHAGMTAVLVAAVIASACGERQAALPAAPPASQVDKLQYRVDPFWQKVLPNNWIIGQVSGLAVDDRDHVWIIHRPASLTPEEAGAAQVPPVSLCCVPAPPVIELDPEGNVVQAWGGPGEGYDWFQMEHGIYVEPNGDVWSGGTASPTTTC